MTVERRLRDAGTPRAVLEKLFGFNGFPRYGAMLNGAVIDADYTELPPSDPIELGPDAE